MKTRPRKADSNLNREIQAMTAAERNDLRAFLIHAKNGGRPGEANYDGLKLLAERAVYASRKRFSEAS
jgi:hypothetical protein